MVGARLVLPVIWRIVQTVSRPVKIVGIEANCKALTGALLLLVSGFIVDNSKRSR